MIVNRVFSPDVYRRIMEASPDKKDDIYRYELMKPFQGKWDCYHIPLKAKYPGGYDIIMANNMMGLAKPSDINGDFKDQIDMLSDKKLWDACQCSIETALKRFTDRGVGLKVEEYLYSIFLANPDNPYTIMNEGYCGDGGIPGYIMGWLVPSEVTVRRLPAALAHETDHNVRYQYIKWTDNVDLGEMIVSEGLAENFATALFGEEFLGPWVARTDRKTLSSVKGIIRDNLGVTGLENITAYLYGDEMAQMQQYPKAGLPYCAGYATGYHLVRYFLDKTGTPIEEATVLPSEVILKEAEGFWKQG